MNQDMTFTKKIEDNIAIFKLSGSMLGETEGGDFKVKLIEVLDSETKRIMIDMSDLKHINSTGLGVFISLLHKVKSNQGELVFAGTSATIVNLLKITKLNTIFHLEPTIEDGIAYLKK